jgi:hypothetical protein
MLCTGIFLANSNGLWYWYSQIPNQIFDDTKPFQTKNTMVFTNAKLPIGALPATQKWGEKREHQDLHTETNTETHHSVNMDDNHNTCDASDKDPRPAKQQKPRAARVTTSTTCGGHTPELRLEQPRPLVAPSTTTPEIDDAQRSPRLITVICQPSSTRATAMPRELLGVRLRHQRRHQRRHQLLSIRSGPSKASLNASGSGMM